MSIKSLVTIIIPAKNEELTITKTLDQLLRKIKIPCDFLIIDDQSTDRTSKLVRPYTERFSRVKLLRTKNQGGFANALILGFNRASGEYVVPVMADLCDDPALINQMIKEIKKGFDIVAGSRYIKGGAKIGGPKLQGFFSKIVCLSLKLITGIPTHDVSNSFKMYRKALLKSLKLESKFGVEFSIYLTLQAYFKGAKITEIPTFWRGREEGTSKFKLFERTPKYLKIYLWAIKQRIIQLASHK